ncbi:hypothetical protein MVES1_000742 [Malassezia vespertilionis]|uniref:uncharacterized protein n=1 Tax=Malassezia vespertilionis TaxID=2020962 RepID=UPI0024B058B0|nr:uncharacterized protein MVES1_000742 [Malassezia vespertilionis]WFD05412.1 hypothetical protein MVES1_000742 [Malassezia vespertilionis]
MPHPSLVGEAQSMFVGTGIMFDDAQKPRPVIRVGSPGEVGDLVICDLIFTTRGPAAGAVVVEWNVREKTQGSVAMFDTHIRIGGTQGTNLELDTCGKDKPLHELPRASFLNLHLTKKSSGYFQNVWIWTADHELDQGAPEQLNILSGRGVLIESQGPVWMYGTASEHQLLYQYSLVNAHNVILAMIQTESPYFQGQHFAPASVCEVRSKSYPDPDCAKRYDSQGAYNQEQEDRAVGLHIENCQDIYVYGAGMYSFFDSYAQDTLPEHACQRRLCTIDDGHGESSRIWMLNMATVGSEILLSVDGRDYYPEKPFREGFCSTATMCLIDSTAQEKIAVL